MSPETRQKRRRSGFWILAFILLAILILGDLNRRMADARRLERDVRALSTEVAVMSTRAAALKTQVAGATGEAQVERWAHEDGKLVRPGEVLVVPISPEGAQAVPTPTLAPQAEDLSTWQIWWTLIFGE